jgi:hypothetical protein
MKNCPKYRLINPPIAQRCDCGYDFEIGEMRKSYLTERDKQLGKPLKLGAIGACLLLGTSALRESFGPGGPDKFMLTIAGLAFALALGIWIWTKNGAVRKQTTNPGNTELGHYLPRDNPVGSSRR